MDQQPKQQTETTTNSTFCDLEANIQKERILNIINDTVRRAELAACLPAIIRNNFELIHSSLRKDEIDFMQQICQKYKGGQKLFFRTGSAYSYQSIRSDNSFYKNDESLGIESSMLSEHKFNEDLAKVIQLLDDNKNLKNLSTIYKISEGALSFIKALKSLKSCIAERLEVGPQEEMNKQTEITQLCKQNERDKEEVRKLKAKLDRQLIESGQAIENKKIEIRKEQEKIENIQKQCRDHIRKKREEAEKQINWDMKNSEFRLEELQNALKISQHQKESQLKEHLASEKDLRTKRFKVESQLVAMLQKYDTDIGDRQAQLEEMSAAYEQEKEEMIKLQECFDQQEIEYQCLMYEKEMYEKQVWEAKLYEVQCKFAARKIQRYYRAYLAMSKARGKKGKGKGKGKKKK